MKCIVIAKQANQSRIKFLEVRFKNKLVGPSKANIYSWKCLDDFFKMLLSTKISDDLLLVIYYKMFNFTPDFWKIVYPFPTISILPVANAKINLKVGH